MPRGSGGGIGSSNPILPIDGEGDRRPQVGGGGAHPQAIPAPPGPSTKPLRVLVPRPVNGEDLRSATGAKAAPALPMLENVWDTLRPPRPPLFDRYTILRSKFVESPRDAVALPSRVGPYPARRCRVSVTSMRRTCRFVSQTRRKSRQNAATLSTFSTSPPNRRGRRSRRACYGATGRHCPPARLTSPQTRDASPLEAKPPAWRRTIAPALT
jgi:hypothetical protein